MLSICSMVRVVGMRAEVDERFTGTSFKDKSSFVLPDKARYWRKRRRIRTLMLHRIEQQVSEMPMR